MEANIARCTDLLIIALAAQQELDATESSPNPNWKESLNKRYIDMKAEQFISAYQQAMSLAGEIWPNRFRELANEAKSIKAPLSAQKALDLIWELQIHMETLDA